MQGKLHDGGVRLFFGACEREAEALRDFLYTKMRGARDDEEHEAGARGESERLADEALVLLREIREEIAGLRKEMKGAGLSEENG